MCATAKCVIKHVRDDLSACELLTLDCIRCVELEPTVSDSFMLLRSQ